METTLEEKFDSFLKRVDSKLDSVLDVNSRLMKENIELRKKIRTVPGEQKKTEPQVVAPSFNNDKKKVIMEIIPDTSKFRFRGNGTFDAKEQIKTFGSASFDKTTKSWVLEPNKTIEFIRSEIEKDFDFQFIEN